MEANDEKARLGRLEMVHHREQFEAELASVFRQTRRLFMAYLTGLCIATVTGYVSSEEFGYRWWGAIAFAAPTVLTLHLLAYQTWMARVWYRRWPWRM